MGILSKLLQTLVEKVELESALKDVKRRRKDAATEANFKVRDELTLALEALKRDDARTAGEIWDRVATNYPDEASASTLCLQILIRLHRLDEAEQIMSWGQKRWPDDPHFPKGLADIAQARRDHEVAVERYAALRRRFPGVADGYTSAAWSLAALGRSAEAEALAKEAMKRFPSEPGGFLEYARAAMRRQDWEAALARWSVVRTEFIKMLDGHLGLVQSAIRLGRYDDAEAALSAALVRFPLEPRLLSELAHIAELRGDITRAVQLWKRVVSCAPLRLESYLEAATPLERLSDDDAAEAVLRTAIIRFPDQRRPFIELVRLLERRGRVDAVAEARTALHSTFPDLTERAP